MISNILKLIVAGEEGQERCGALTFTYSPLVPGTKEQLVVAGIRSFPHRREVKEALYLALRELTRRTSKVLIMYPECKSGKMGSCFSWKMATTAQLFMLTMDEEIVSREWLNAVLKQKDHDAKVLGRQAACH